MAGGSLDNVGNAVSGVVVFLDADAGDGVFVDALQETAFEAFAGDTVSNSDFLFDIENVVAVVVDADSDDDDDADADTVADGGT